MRLTWAAPALLLHAIAWGDLVTDVRTALSQGNFALARSEVEAFRARSGTTPETLEALSWLGRGALMGGNYGLADTYASETRKLALDLLKRRPIDSQPQLAAALGAAVEIQAQVMAARGERAEAVAYLRGALDSWRNTSIAIRIQKNLNLLSLEGKPAPALDVAHWLGPKPAPLAALRGHPVLLFFWAHWCSDCKWEVGEIARLESTYRAKGLVVLGPTQYYGYAAGGVEAGPEAELRYIDQVRRQYYAALGGMPAPVSTENFKNYGASTTPTLVLVDGRGIVRMYHPGAMPYGDLAAQLDRALRP